jgi:aspartate-semialdehyde dehydrogenase
MGYNVAIVGATGNVGREMLEILSDRQFPVDEAFAIASRRSLGVECSFGDKILKCQDLEQFDFSRVDFALMSAGGSISKEWSPKIGKAGCVVIDNSSAWRYDPDVPLVVPEVNPDDIQKHQGIIASPNCSTTQMVVAMKPLHDAGRIRRVVVSTYQATSGAGVGGQRDLVNGSRAALENSQYKCEAFAYPIAFNLIPQIGSPKHQGYTSEEMKMVRETHKIFGDDSIRICPTCVRVPVANCHSESILVETEMKITVERARELFAATPGIVVVDDVDNKCYPMPINCDQRDEVFIGRIREDLSSPNGLAFWCVSDNLRKGAATNAVQIAELLVHGN